MKGNHHTSGLAKITWKVNLDISRNVGDRAEAMRLGRLHKQLAIFNLDAMTSEAVE